MGHVCKAYYPGMLAIANKEIDLDTDVIKVALMETGFTYDLTDEDMADINATELNAGGGDTKGYFAGFAGTGRQTLAAKAIAEIATGMKFDADDTTFAALEASLADIHAAVVYHHNTSDADSKLLFVIDFDPVFDPDGNDLNIQWNTAGIATWANAA